MRLTTIFYWCLGGALSILLLGLGAWSMYEFGRYEAGFYLLGSERREQTLLETIEQQSALITELEAQNAILIRGEQIDRIAQTRLKDTLTDLQSEILELKEEIAFYRGILAPEDNHQGLRIERFELLSTPLEQRFHYKFVLTQALNRDRQLEGTLHLDIDGLQGEEKTNLDLSVLSTDGQQAHPFRFKYFQILEGDIVLPTGHIPIKVNVTIKPSNKGMKQFTTTYKWSEIKRGKKHVGQ